MLTLTLLVVGKLRESFWQDAAQEYRKRLGGPERVRIVEIADVGIPENASFADEETVKTREAERLLAKIGPRDFVIALDRAGKTLSSEQFAGWLARCAAEQSISAATFVIGGALGLHESVIARADFSLSFGAFTFPHQLMRVMLLEQLYRALTIERGGHYHK